MRETSVRLRGVFVCQHEDDQGNGTALASADTCAKGTIFNQMGVGLAMNMHIRLKIGLARDVGWG